MSRSYYAKPGTRVLIVDDEPGLIELIGRFLGRLGYETVSAGTVEEALARLENGGSFAAAIVDMVMPEPGGEELARRILETFPAMRVLATSGYLQDMAELEAAGPGRVLFLHKPFTPEMLGSTLHALLG